MEEWIRSIPPVTRTWLIATAAVTICGRLSLISPYVLFFDSALIFRSFQLWRIVTPFFYFGRPSFNWFFQMMMLHNFGAKLEFNTFASGGGEGRGSTADYFWQLLLGAAALLPMAAWLGIHVLGPSLLAFVIYLWSRRNPEEQATFWFFRVPGALLPWIMVGFTFLLGDDPVPDLLGIAAAHAYYYIVDVLPRTPGPFANTRSWLQTPERVVFAFGAMPTGLGARQPGAARGPNPPPQHRWGGGRRLAD